MFCCPALLMLPQAGGSACFPFQHPRMVCLQEALTAASASDTAESLWIGCSPSVTFGHRGFLAVALMTPSQKLPRQSLFYSFITLGDASTSRSFLSCHSGHSEKLTQALPCLASWPSEVALGHLAGKCSSRKPHGACRKSSSFLSFPSMHLILHPPPGL